jgi:hypothetical protein
MAESYSPELARALGKLKVGDIVMFRSKGRLGRLIRRATGSYWSHVGLIFDVPEEGALGNDHLVIEADRAGGVQLHRLSTYVNDPWNYTLGFKRVKALTDEERERFRGFFLDAVDTPYDMRRLEAYFLHRLFEHFSGRSLAGFFARKTTNIKRFICTTFAQRAYYLAVAPEKRSQVLFRGHEPEIGILDQMEVIEPRHIAASPVTEWLYNEHA